MNKLIFDEMEPVKAKEFASTIQNRYPELKVEVYYSEEEARTLGNLLFPWELYPTIVLVERCESRIEKSIRVTAKRFGGTFVGT